VAVLRALIEKDMPLQPFIQAYYATAENFLSLTSSQITTSLAEIEKMEIQIQNELEKKQVFYEADEKLSPPPTLPQTRKERITAIQNSLIHILLKGFGILTLSSQDISPFLHQWIHHGEGQMGDIWINVMLGLVQEMAVHREENIAENEKRATIEKVSLIEEVNRLQEELSKALREISNLTQEKASFDSHISSVILPTYLSSSHTCENFRWKGRWRI